MEVLLLFMNFVHIYTYICTAVIVSVYHMYDFLSTVKCMSCVCTHTLRMCTGTAVDDIFEVFIFSRSLVLALVSGFSRTPVGVRVVVGIVLRIAHWC